MKRKTLATAIMLALCLCLTACKSSDYEKAVELQRAGDYEAAAEIFNLLEDYEDSASHLEECENYINAIEAFNDSANELNIKNSELEKAIETASAIAYSEKPALDETLRPKLETAISETKAAKNMVPGIPAELGKIVDATNSMNKVDYSATIENLIEKQNVLQYSMKQYDLVNNPDEAYVIECLGKVPGVIDIAAATEDNDPNGKLHKAGGYTAAVYFSHQDVDQSMVYGTSLIDKGTDAGGQVEVYATVEDAEKRNIYLSAFDGTIISSGAHIVVGTCIVRTSDELKASQQNELTESIVSELTKVN